MNTPYYIIPESLIVTSNGQSKSVYFPAKICKEIDLNKGDRINVIISPDRLDAYFPFERAMQEITQNKKVYSVFNPEVIYYRNKKGKFVKSRRMGAPVDFSVTEEEIKALWTLFKEE